MVNIKFSVSTTDFSLIFCVFFFFFTGAEIRSVCTEAGMFAIRERRKVRISFCFSPKKVLCYSNDNVRII